MTDIDICPVCLAPVTCHREKTGDWEHVSVRYKAPRWVPVEERLPEKMKIVLVFKRRTAHFIWSDATWSIETDWCGEDGWSRTPHNGCFAVTHWMPLPEPPKEE